MESFTNTFQIIAKKIYLTVKTLELSVSNFKI